jgi:hypothetical protein
MAADTHHFHSPDLAPCNFFLSRVSKYKAEAQSKKRFNDVSNM